MLVHGLGYLNASSSEALLIGDSPFDAEGAAIAGVDFAAVLYGYGFRTYDEAAQWKPVWIARSAKEMEEVLG